MKHHVQEATRFDDFGAKAQAWPAGKMFHPSLQFYVHSSLKWVCFLLRFIYPFYGLPISIKKVDLCPKFPLLLAIFTTYTWQAAADAFLKPNKKGTTRKGKGGKTEEKEKSAQ